MSRQEDISGLLGRLRGALIKQRLILGLAGLLVAAAVLAGVAALMSILAGVMIVPVWLKLTVMFLAGLAALGAFGWLAVARLWQGSEDEIALRLEHRHTGLKGRLIAAVQFARMRDMDRYSPELVAMTLNQAKTRAEGVAFGEVVTYRSLGRSLRWVTVAAVVLLGIILISPGLFDHAYNVYSHPTEEIAPPIGYTLSPFPGSTEWIKYRDIEFGAVLTGGELPRSATIHHRLAGGSWQESHLDLRDRTAAPAADGDSLTVTMTLRQISRSFDYWVEAGRRRTEIQRVDVVDRPRVDGIKLSVFYPKYTGLQPSVIDENNGSVSAVLGSRVNFDVTSSLPIEAAALVLEDSSRIDLEVTDRLAEGAVTLDQTKAYYIELTDRLGEHNPDPIEYHLTAIPDEYPSIDVLSPGFDVNLGDRQILPMKIRIFDDFGFSSVAMKYTLFRKRQPSEEHVAMLGYSDRIKTEGDIEFDWDIAQFDLYPGDWVVYHFEVADNDEISGPKVSSSRQFVARVPSLDEIISQSEAQSQQRLNRAENLLKQGRDAAQRMKNLARKLEAQQQEQPQAEWQHQKELTNLAEQNEELVQNLEKMAEEMENSVDKLSEQSHLSRQLLEKMQQIQKLFEDVATPEMRAAQQRLMEALKNMDPNEMRQAMEDFQMSMEEMLERLDRTIALLKRMQLEQKMEAMLRQLEELVEQQVEINEETESSPPDNLPSLAPREDTNRGRLEDLKKEADDLAELSKEAEMDDVPQMQEFMDALKNSDAEQDMEAMSQSLKGQKQKQAAQEGETALSKMTQMLEQMQESLAQMQGSSQEEMEMAMRAAIDDANYLSHREEELYRNAAELAMTSQVLRDMAKQQQDLQSSCQGLKNRITELGRQSPFIASELQRLVDGATDCMGRAMTEFGDKRRNPAMRQQREAMSGLNHASLRLMESLQQMNECNKGGSCDKNMSQLQSLCNKQKKLNNQTKQCQNPSSSCPNPGGANPQFDPSGRESLQRLAGEQGSIRKSLEELAHEFGDSRQVLGRLEDMAGEMKEIEEALAAGDVGQNTQERQLRIYSRMLQAARSLQRRDFAEQRQANTAPADIFAPPPALPAELLGDESRIEDRLRKYLSGGYPPQYEKQIKAYFRALLQMQTTPTTGEAPRP